MGLERRAWLFALGALWLVTAPAIAAPAALYYFDPDAGIKATEPFEQKLNAYFAAEKVALSVRAFRSVRDLREAIASAPPNFIVIPPYVRGELGADVALEPMLVRVHKRATVYELVLVGQGSLASLKGQTLAASGDATTTAFLDGILLKATGLVSTDLRVLTVSKDIDAILAAGTGQVAGAAASRQSVELVQKANPAVAEKLAIVHTVSAIPYATLYSYGPQDGATIAGVKRVLGEMHRSRTGKDLLKLLKADRLIAPGAQPEDAGS